MADSKITALTAISTVDPTADPLVIVDVSDTSMAASGTTKKSTINQLLGAGGTATLASATITGDLTVDTSVLKVDTLNNRVGIGTASPEYKLHVGDPVLASVGTSIDSLTQTSHIFKGTPDASGYEYAKVVSGRDTTAYTYGSYLAFYTEGKNSGTTDTSIERLRVDSSGQVGIGVTPSAWNGGYKAIDLGSNAGSWSVTTGISDFALNAFNNASGQWIYKSTSAVSLYRQQTGQHQWFNAPSGTAGTAITFTQAMTLDASGRLLVGTANASVTSETGCRLLLNNGATGHFTLAVTTNQSTAATSCYDFYSTSAAAYRFYVTSAGVINATNTTISAISDARLKENVQDIDVGLGAILALKPRKFDWKAGKGKDIKGDRGFIAQEFEQVFPQLVDEWKDAAPEGEAPYKSVRQDLIPVLVKAIQELTARVQTLEAK